MHGRAAITKWRYIALMMVANMIKPCLFNRWLDNANLFHGVFARKQIWFRPCFVGNPPGLGLACAIEARQPAGRQSRFSNERQIGMWRHAEQIVTSQHM